MFFGDLMCMKGERVPLISRSLKELLGSAHWVVGNCESPVTTQEMQLNASHNYFRHKMSVEFVEAFISELGVSAGQCVLSVANNHIGDQGEEGLRITLQNLESIGVTTVGKKRLGELSVAKIRERGLTVGIAAWTHWLNRDVFRNATGVLGVDDIIVNDWEAQKEKEKLDCLVGTPHWEYEFRHFPKSNTRATAKELTKRGFDILVGHHPHVIQPLERFDNSLCLYSLGNLNGPSFPFLCWPLRLGCVFEILIFSSGPNKGRLAGYEIHPFVQEKRRNRTELCRLNELPDEKKKKFVNRLSLTFQIDTTELLKTNSFQTIS
jgi:poly-gamma-glutamate synthesis protein (capsule biosynthesis protein)